MRSTQGSLLAELLHQAAPGERRTSFTTHTHTLVAFRTVVAFRAGVDLHPCANSQHETHSDANKQQSVCALSPRAVSPVDAVKLPQGCDDDF